MEITFRHLTHDDVPTLRRLASKSPPLGLHTAFTYWLVGHYFGDYSLLALDGDGTELGYVMCITKRDETDLLYVWQIGVLPQYRRQKIAEKLLDAIYEKKVRGGGIRRMQVTIDPHNVPSNKLFESFAGRHGLSYQAIGEASFFDPVDGVKEDETLIEMAVC